MENAVSKGIILNLGMSFNYVFLMGTGFCVIGLLVAIFGFQFSKEEIATANALQPAK